MSDPVAWRYKTHDGQFVFMEQQLTREQRERGYYLDEDDDEEVVGPFYWTDETPLYERP